MKEFLSQHDVEFVERDISSEESALQELESLGFLTTPVTVIEGEVIVGYDRPALARLLSRLPDLGIASHDEKR